MSWWLKWRGGRAALEKEPDAVLVQRMLSGEPEPFDIICERYRDKLKQFAYGFFHSEAEAEDMAQEVLLKARLKLSQFQAEVGSFYSWIMEMAHNMCIDKQRRDKRVRFTSLSHALSADEGETSMEEQFSNFFSDPQSIHWELALERKVVLRDCIDQLKDKQREVIEWVFFEERTQKELADKLDIEESSIRGRKERALNKLRICVEGKIGNRST